MPLTVNYRKVRRLTIERLGCVTYLFGAGSPQLEAGTDHPEVLAAVEEEANNARVAEFPITVEMYMTALKGGIEEARERTKEINPGGTRYINQVILDVYPQVLSNRLGGWVLDGFPVTREQWAGMLEHQLIPDCVISLQDNSEKCSMLAERVCQVKGIEQTSTAVAAEGLDSTTGESVPESVCHINVSSWNNILLLFVLECWSSSRIATMAGQLAGL